MAKKQAKTGRCIDCGKAIQSRSLRCRVCECKSRTKPIEQRFWKKVDKAGPNGCWVWTANYIRSGNPYGLFMISTGNFSLAHRFSWELCHKKPIPKGLHILHKCDNPKCVNPDHLFIGTHSDNMRDMADKGRTGIRLGEKNSQSKLTRKQVKQIRERYNSTNVSQSQLAREYGISQAAIWYIIRRKNWKNV